MTVSKIVGGLVAMASVVGVGYGQSFGAGVKIGVLTSEPFTATSVSITSSTFVTATDYLPSNRRLTVGPMVELRLSRGIAVEASALLRRVTYVKQRHVYEIEPDPFLPFDETLEISTRARSLELPILLKYRISWKRWQPFIGFGGAVRHVFGIERLLGNGLDLLPLPDFVDSAGGSPPELEHPTTGGFGIAGGLEWRTSVLRIAPEIRYCRWASPSFRDPDGALVSRANQVELLLSLGF